MLRINLLPRTINEGARKKTFLLIWAVANAAVVVLFLIWLGGVQSSYSTAKTANDVAHDKKNTFDGVVSKINDVNTQIADTQKKEDFVANSEKYNDAWPATFELMRDVTSDHVVLHSLSLDPAAHKTLNVAGFSPDEATIIGWWMYLRNNQDKFDSVTFTLPPHGYQPGETGAAGLGMGTGMMGGGRRLGMMGGSPMGGSVGPPGMMGGGRMGMMGGGPPMGGAGRMSMMGGGPPMGGMMGMGRGTSAAGAASENYLEGRKGLEFTAMVVLKNPMAGGMQAPSWPPVDTGAAAGGFGGMMGGMPGGMMGGMGPGGPMGGMPGMPAGARGMSAGAPPQAGGAAGGSSKKDD